MPSRLYQTCLMPKKPACQKPAKRKPSKKRQPWEGQNQSAFRVTPNHTAD
jgi:hypothetical protein